MKQAFFGVMCGANNLMVPQSDPCGRFVLFLPKNSSDKINRKATYGQLI